MTKIYLIILAALIGACSLVPVTKAKSNQDLNYPPELQDVHGLIVQEKTVDAQAKIDDYINKAENIHWYGHAYFLKGFLFEMEEKYKDSIKFYRRAIQHGSKYESAVEAKALYNLSFVFEKLDQRQDLISTLLDLMKRRSFFNRLTGQVEIPARLAAAYASQGKMKEGLIFHREAAQNFKQLVRVQTFKAPKEEVSKSLYYLGFSVFDENNEQFHSLIRKLNVGQKYFLASAEASKSQWSEKSRDRLKNEYDKAWAQVLNYKPEGFDNDPLAFKKQKHRKQLVMASDMYDLMHRLRAEEFPMGDVNPRSKVIVDQSSQWIAKIEDFAQKLDVGPETTRNKKIKNKKLAIYVEEKFEEVKVNKEQVKAEPIQKEKKPVPGKDVQETPDIGKDPNL